jgi:hypothetical protein
MGNSSLYGPREWDEARRRAETYLRALRGRIGTAERECITDAMEVARCGHDDGTHPVTRVMESLFDLLSAADGESVATVPPMQRASMLPEQTVFPLHDTWRRLRRAAFLPIGGIQ